QAEDGIRDFHVTGVQTCALPICRLPVHASMAGVSQVIWETCKTYLGQQGKFLIGLWGLIAICMAYYFGGLVDKSAGHVLVILASDRNSVVSGKRAPPPARPRPQH